MKKILILVTNHATLGSTEEKNGTYAPELTHALHAFLEAGLAYDIASIKGGHAPIYGDDVDDEINKTLLANDELLTRLRNTLPISQVNTEDYCAVFYPGGFGLLSDLAENHEAAKLTAGLYQNGAIVGAVCHGPAGLLPVTLANGEPLIADKALTSFTREEEVDYGTYEKIPFLLEEALTRKAGRFSKVSPWGEHLVEDGRLITGQNPASAAAVGLAMVKQLQARNDDAA